MEDGVYSTREGKVKGEDEEEEKEEEWLWVWVHAEVARTCPLGTVPGVRRSDRYRLVDPEIGGELENRVGDTYWRLCFLAEIDWTKKARAHTCIYIHYTFSLCRASTACAPCRVVFFSSWHHRHHHHHHSVRWTGQLSLYINLFCIQSFYNMIHLRECSAFGPYAFWEPWLLQGCIIMDYTSILHIYSRTVSSGKHVNHGSQHRNDSNNKRFNMRSVQFGLKKITTQ